MTKTSKFAFAGIGEISHGTARAEDLIEAFASTLESLIKKSYADMAFEDLRLCMGLLGDAAKIDAGDNGDYNDADELVIKLSDALNEVFAPPYAFFGAIEGDGSSFGFWPDLEALDQARQDGTLVTFEDLSDAPCNLFATLSDAFEHRDWYEIGAAAKQLDALTEKYKHIDYAELMATDFVVVNDHGNTSLFYADGTPIWAVV